MSLMGLASTAMTAETYLEWEREQPERHEYCGDVFAMAVGSPRHNALSAALARSPD
jgi:hypothetical protein